MASLSGEARAAPRRPLDLGRRAEQAAAPLLCPANAETLTCRIAASPEVNARVRRRSPRAPSDRSGRAASAVPAPLAPSPTIGRARVKLESEENARHRPAYYRDARIHWEGPEEPPIALTSLSEARVDGPKPGRYASPYLDEEWRGGLDRAVRRAGSLFPQLERAAWLRDVGMMKEARWAVRDVALEYRALRRKPAPRSRPYELERARMVPLIDNRREKKATWGYTEDKPRWPVPRAAAARERLRKRQAAIIARRQELRPFVLHALQDVGDYYMVRRFALEDGLRKRESLSRAYPRAFPDLVVPQAERWGVNPYLIWALMTVESSYNPDSVSTARALGLLQVIPRTGLKTAEMLGDDEFGHDDLLDEDVAIRHGVFYFSRLVRKFNGQELLAMAGYNGGPHRVAEWIDMRGDMPLDEFVEEIPYDQAREYTKKVTRFVHLYLRVYEGIDDLYIGQNLDRDWASMPNF